VHADFQQYFEDGLLPGAAIRLHGDKLLTGDHGYQALSDGTLNILIAPCITGTSSGEQLTLAVQHHRWKHWKENLVCIVKKVRIDL